LFDLFLVKDSFKPGIKKGKKTVYAAIALIGEAWRISDNIQLQAAQGTLSRDYQTFLKPQVP
jgi:hypothetical protein